MPERAIKNLPASVRQRLANIADESKLPFQDMLRQYAMERFLYRLSQSKHANKFILKGALMFTAWGGPTSRPTRDIDLLGRMENTIEAVTAHVKDICAQRVEADGLEFDENSVKGVIIKEDADYSGVRVTFIVTLQTARVPMQIDMGFGDVVTPLAGMTTYPTILDYPAPKLLGYPRETVVAEKLQAMVKLGILNSRMKDFYDLWLLSMQFAFDGPTLCDAVQKTFAHRATELPESILALTPVFAGNKDKQRQWQGFLKKSKLTEAPESLQTVTDALRTFLLPLVRAAKDKIAFPQRWLPAGSWQSL